MSPAPGRTRCTISSAPMPFETVRATADGQTAHDSAAASTSNALTAITISSGASARSPGAATSVIGAVLGAPDGSTTVRSDARGGPSSGPPYERHVAPARGQRPADQRPDRAAPDHQVRHAVAAVVEPEAASASAAA